jgi:hypothetical protein
MKLIAVIAHNYYYSFISLLVNWYNNRFLILIRQFILIPNRTDEFFELSIVPLPTWISSARISSQKSCYNWRSVSQYVLVSNSIWNLWTDIIFCLKVAVLSLWGALSDERSGLSPVSHCHQCHWWHHCQRFNIIYIVHVTCFKYIQYILDPRQHRLNTADHLPGNLHFLHFAIAISTSRRLGLGTNGSSMYGTSICLTSLTLCTFNNWEK